MPKKFYIAYKVAKNFLCIEPQRGKLLLTLKLDPSAVEDMPDFGRDMRGIGHYGTGDLELAISDEEQLEIAKSFIERAYQAVGG